MRKTGAPLATSHLSGCEPCISFSSTYQQLSLAAMIYTGNIAWSGIAYGAKSPSML
jgi:hypothetical protein